MAVFTQPLDYAVLCIIEGWAIIANLVEQDHRAVKRIVRPMMGFQTFRSARVTLQGIELMHMIKKGQMVADDSQGLPAAEQFYSLAA
jgi:transposase-like protein